MGLNYDSEEDLLANTGIAVNKSYLSKGKKNPSEGKKKSKSKFHNVKQKYEGITFDSKAELAYYKKLVRERSEGKLMFFRQPVIDLPGLTEAGRKMVYRSDFLVIHLVNGQPTGYEIVDVKGLKSHEYKVKKSVVEAIYPIKIKEVK